MTCARTFAAAFLASVAAAPASPLTLERAHELAVRHFERIARSEVAVKAAQEEYRRRFSAVYPQLFLIFTETIQDVPGPIAGQDPTDTLLQKSFFRRQSPELKFELRQLLFSGFREWAGISASKELERMAARRRERTAQLLYAEVALPFYGIAQRRVQLDLYRDLARILDERIEELTRFERLGRSRTSERLTVEAEQKMLEAETEEVRGELARLRALLGFYLASDPPEALDPGGRELSPLPPLDDCLRDASDRPDLKALASSLDSLKDELRVFRGGYWPQVDFTARLYPYRVGLLQDVTWDLEFLFTWPLFEGFRTKAEVEQARLRLRNERLTYQETQRQAALEVREKHADLAATAGRFAALAEAIRISERSFNLQTKEYRLGLVTNLEVLRTLQDLHRSKQRLELARYRAKFQAADLAVARGRVPR